MMVFTPPSKASVILIVVLSFTHFLGHSVCRVDLGGGHMGLAMLNTCGNPQTASCSELDDDWPDMGLACPIAKHDIPRHTLALMSATVIQIGHYKTVEKKDFPINECYTSKPNRTVSNYGFVSQGSFDMWFFAHDKCDCPPNHLPVCNDQASESDKCNLRTFTLCKVTKKAETCTPKHHEGWVPLPTIVDGKPVEEKNETMLEEQTKFDPTHRQQTIFYDISGAWWRLMEIWGVWGVI